MRRIFRTGAGIIIGHVVVVVLTVIGFALFPDQRVPRDGGLLVALAATLIAVVAGVAGGYTAAFLARIRPLLSAAIVAVPLVVESVWLLTTRTPADEILFDSVGAVVLILSTLGGGAAREFQLRSHRRSETALAA
ncbi:MAG TPA: hypothetical protein VM534_06110 [Thermoanaerobaculia bacterium]|nr:hypothetical protein [Thermoanaerobaculia bacterium]